MENPVEPRSIGGAAPESALQRSFEAIDQAHPLQMPGHFQQGHTGPRLDRLDAKTAYLVEYIAYLEQRIERLEARPEDRATR